MPEAEPISLGRRAFLHRGPLVLPAAGLDLARPGDRSAAEASGKGGVRLGLVTDLHYADKPPAGTRHYREALDRLAGATEQFEKEKLSFVVELGDLVDAADSVKTE